MGPSTFISAALHVAIVLFAIVGLSSSHMSAPLVAVPVDLSTTADITKIKAGMKDAKDDAPLAAKPEEKKPQAVKEKTATAPEQTAAIKKPEKTAEAPKPPAPKPAPKPEKTVEAPKPQPKPAAPARKPEPPKETAKADTPKPAPKAKEFDTDRISALLNKIPDAVDEPKPQDWTAETKPAHGQSNGTEMAMSVNEIDALRARIADCWTPPPGGLGADAIVVKVRLKLNQDGTLEGYPSVVNAGSSPFFQAAADSAVRAVFQCQPYALPVAKYALWRDMILNFDPSQMYRRG
jgi:outer membrane biosynthesis protein TonB